MSRLTMVEEEGEEEEELVEEEEEEEFLFSSGFKDEDICKDVS